jgi:hypothetical protein
MTNSPPIDILVKKMEWIILNSASQGDKLIFQTLSNTAIAMISICASIFITSWFFLEKTLVKSIELTGAPRLGLIGTLSITGLMFTMSPLLSSSLWRAALGDTHQYLAFIALNMQYPINDFNSVLSTEFLTKLHLGANKMVQDVNTRTLGMTLLNLLISITILRSVLLHGNSLIKKGSVFWLVLGSLTLTQSIVNISDPVMWSALNGKPDLFLLSEGILVQ